MISLYPRKLLITSVLHGYSCHSASTMMQTRCSRPYYSSRVSVVCSASSIKTRSSLLREVAAMIGTCACCPPQSKADAWSYGELLVVSFHSCCSHCQPTSFVDALPIFILPLHIHILLGTMSGSSKWPGVCTTGNSQSPVNVPMSSSNSPGSAASAGLTSFFEAPKFKYGASESVDVFNTGHGTMQVSHVCCAMLLLSTVAQNLTPSSIS